MNKALLTILFFSILPLINYAQPFIDVANVQLSRFPQTNTQKLPGTNNESWEANANLFVPIQLKNNNVLLGGISYDQVSMKASSEKGYNANLISASLQLGMITKLSNRWNMMLMAFPKANSDFRNFNSKHLQMGGAAVFTYKVRNSLKYKVGLYYNREFFGNYFMPLAGIEWKATDRIYVYGLLPGSINLEYRICPKLYTGLAYRDITASFRISDNNEKYYVREGEKFWGDLRIMNFYNYYLTKNLVLCGDIGYSGFRYFEQYNNSDNVEHTHPAFYRLQDNFFFDLGIAFRVRLDKEYND